MAFYGTLVSGAGWIVPKTYTEKVGDDGFKKHRRRRAVCPAGEGAGRKKRETMLQRIQQIAFERVRFAVLFDYVWPSGVGPVSPSPRSC